MLDRSRYAIAFLILLLGVAIMADAVFAQDGAEAPPADLPAERASPQATVFGLITAVRDVQDERVADLDAARLRATTYLQTAVSSPVERIQAIWPQARRLKEVLDFHRFYETDDLPDAAEIGAAESWTDDTAQGPITLVRTTDGWLFAAETLSRVDLMLVGFERSGAEKVNVVTMGDRVRARFPALAGRALFLQHWQWLGIVSLILLAWMLHRIVGFVMGTVIGAALDRRGWLPSTADAARAAGRPVGFFAVALLIAALGPWLELPKAPVDLDKWLIEIGAKLFASLGAVLILYRLADVVAARLQSAAEGTESRLDDQLVPLIRKSIKILVTVGGALFILDNLEADIWSLLAGAGVAGVAVAFAAKDTIANLFGSITVFLDRPFQVGDWVVVGGVEGTVEEVGFRSTRVRTFYNSLVSVPNAKLVDGIVDNMGMRRYRRFKTTLGIRYDTPPERIEAFCHGTRQIVLANEHMRHDYFEIYLNDWGASSLNILVYVFFEVPDWDAELRERQNFMIEVIRLARDLGVGFAFPTQTLEIEALPDRPAPSPRAVDADEMAAITAGYARFGDRARPGGTARFSSREREETEPEARGGES